MSSRIILITGANRGIGFCIAQSLGMKSSDDTIIIASRTTSSAVEAIEQLKGLGVKARLVPLQLDVTLDAIIEEAVQMVEQTYGKLDVLINNAGIAVVPSTDLSEYRQTYNSILDTNVTSVGLVVLYFMPLLKRSEMAKVINISSGRASITLLTTGQLPPTASVPYSVSKVALNVLTLEMTKVEPNVLFYLANPGHCKTALNGYKGKKDPLIGAEVVTDLVYGHFQSGFWHKDNGTLEKMAW